MGLPVVAALIRLEAQTKRVHAKTKDAVHNMCTALHDISSGTLKMRGRNVCSKTVVLSQSCAVEA
jgi:hypothetical protein